MGKTIVDWQAAMDIRRGQTLESDTGLKFNLQSRQAPRAMFHLLSNYPVSALLCTPATGFCDCRTLT